jgi:hypothetical protein
LVMIILLALTFKRCIAWVCEQRTEHGAKYTRMSSELQLED